MDKVIIKSVDDFLSLKGLELGKSNWFVVNQKIINGFADASFDHQWIHVDEARASKESPTASTIAHAYFSVSLIPFLLDGIFKVQNLKKILNYSIKEMVFKAPVPVNSKIRLVATLNKARDLGNICRAEIGCRFEVEGQEEPVTEGVIVYIYYFNNQEANN